MDGRHPRLQHSRRRKSESGAVKDGQTCITDSMELGIPSCLAVSLPLFGSNDSGTFLF